MQAEAGLDISHFVPVRNSNASLELIGGISAIGSKSTGSNGAYTSPEYEDGRGKVMLGVNFEPSNALRLTASAFYDGIGVDDYKSYGLQVGIDLSF